MDEGEGRCTARIFRARFRILPLPGTRARGYAKLCLSEERSARAD
jgi:hypothetical protein